MKGEPWILVVEDDHDDVAIIERARQRVAPGVEMRAVGSAREAIEVLHWARPALILLDLHLPSVHGLDLLALIRSHPTAGAAPVLCMSSRDDDRTVSAAYAATANGFMVKVGDYDAFFDGVCQTLHYWLGANRVPRDCGENRVYV